MTATKMKKHLMWGGISVLVAVFGCGGDDDGGGGDADGSVPPASGHADGGAIIISGTFVPCPTIANYSVQPSLLGPGQSANLTGSPTEPHTPALRMSWSAPLGSIGDPIAASTTYLCAAPGTVNVTLTLTDGACRDVVAVPVTCTP